MLQDELARIKARHGYALLFDAHFFASMIPQLFKGKLPDLSLGTNGGESCTPALSDRLVNCCEQQRQYTYVLNGHFEGGYITRAYGQPHARQYAIQLELTQVNYMSEQYPFAFEPQRAISLQCLLKQMIQTCRLARLKRVSPCPAPASFPPSSKQDALHQNFNETPY